MRFAALSLALALTAACNSHVDTAAEPKTAAVTDSGASKKDDVALSLATFASDQNGFDTKSFWLDTGREVVVFDAQFTEGLANKLIAEIRAKTKNPIRYLVITHPNPDKFNGASAFQAIGAKVIASEATAKAIPGVHVYKKHFFVEVAKMFTDATYPALAHVDTTFHGDFDLPLEGGVKVSLHELAHAGVSSTQTVAFVPSAKALVVGDLVHPKAHAWLEGGIVDGKATPTLASWKQALDELSSYSGAVVYGGRGEAAPVQQAVADEKAYLDKMTALVTKYVQDLGPAKSELFGAKAGEHHKKLADLAKAAFPDYALAYMVEYGVYGLANQIASK
jgi:glyoxylase-like metal-dependent hydrolase (beta-lactamase superfamily II)